LASSPKRLTKPKGKRNVTLPCHERGRIPGSTLEKDVRSVTGSRDARCDMLGNTALPLQPQIDTANASNFVDFFATLGDVPGAGTETTDGFVRATGPAAHPFFNRRRGPPLS
jgi:hypothetical protein